MLSTTFIIVDVVTAIACDDGLPVVNNGENGETPRSAGVSPMTLLLTPPPRLEAGLPFFIPAPVTHEVAGRERGETMRAPLLAGHDYVAGSGGTPRRNPVLPCQNTSDRGGHPV